MTLLVTSLTMLPSKRQKLYGVFAFLSAKGLMNLCSCKHTYYCLGLAGFPGNGDGRDNNIPGSRKKCQMRLLKVLPIHFCNHIAIKKAETLWTFNFLSAKGLMNLCSCKYTYEPQHEISNNVAF